ncbi:CGNR zinc finger domain-containing protein [Dactylosporangium sp. McL0621]|uniref:CGNR zinc finger domain-containing protein n=1 Tax=Dactylosporangium sp. McL0621 TaxID=3415678 RepID=UPI003CF6AB82
MYQWCFIGGHLALDLCNTLSWRLDPARSVDRLGSATLLADWFEAATGARARADDAALERVRGLRGAAIGLIDAHLAGEPATGDDVRTVHEAWRAALAEARVSDRLPLTETVPADRPVPYLALAVAELLRRPDLSTLRRCDGEGCGWLFLDTTRNRSRRWCDPDDCGNRARVRAYSRRRRAT